MGSSHLHHLSALSSASKHIHHLKQGILITGLGLNKFQNQLDMIPEITVLFTRAVSEDRIQSNMIIGDLDEFTMLNTSNQYFMPRRDAQLAQELAFAHDVDSHGNLARLLGSALVHIEGNTVSYYKHVGDTK